MFPEDIDLLFSNYKNKGYWKRRLGIIYLTFWEAWGKPQLLHVLHLSLMSIQHNYHILSMLLQISAVWLAGLLSCDLIVVLLFAFCRFCCTSTDFVSWMNTPYPFLSINEFSLNQWCSMLGTAHSSITEFWCYNKIA